MNELMGSNDALADPNKTFFYPVSMLSSNREHADIYHDILYNRVRIQAESITKDSNLASKISEEIIKTYSPSMNYLHEGKIW